MKPALEVWKATVRYAAEGGGLSEAGGNRQREVTIVDGVTFRIQPGTTLGLVGESGSGKTTLAQAILGLVPMADGHVLVNGHVFDSHATSAPRDPWREIRREIGVTFQDAVASLDPRMTLGESIAEPLRVYRVGGRDKRAEVARLMEQVGLSPALRDRYPHQISGGQARRVSVARAIALKPSLLIADEPTAGLDLSVQGELLNLLVRLQTDFGLSSLLITHNLPVARQITDRIAIMYLGRIVEMGPTETIFAAPHHPYTQALIAARGGHAEERPRPLPGEVPSLTRRPDGCEFHTRCIHAQPRCRVEAPAEPPVGAEHQVRCHYPLADEHRLVAQGAGRKPLEEALPTSSRLGQAVPAMTCETDSTRSAGGHAQKPPGNTPTRISRRQLMTVLAGGAIAAGGAVTLGRQRTRDTVGNGVPVADHKVLRIQNDGDIMCLDPANRGGWYDQVVTNAIFSGLCQFDGGEGWTWSKDAAQTIRQIDDVTIAFELRPGLQWTDGYGEVTAEDVKYSYERFADPRVQAIFKDDWAALDKVEVTGRYSGVIRLKRPYPPLFSSTLPETSGLIVCKAAVEKAGGRIRMDPLATCGPYRLEKWEPRKEVTLVRHEGWPGDRPYYDEIRLVAIDEERVAHVAFDAGDLDMTKIEPGDIAPLREENDPDVNLIVKPALAYTFIGMNVEHEKLRDIRVRRAIQQAIDPQRVVDATFGPDLVDRAYGLVPPSLPGSRRRLLYPYDPARAKRLLSEAGAENLELTLTFSHDVAYATAAQAIQAQLAEVGIRLRLDQGDAAAQAAQQQDTAGGSWRTVEAYMITNTTTPDPSWVTAWYTCDQIGKWNWARACSPKWDALNDAAIAETNPSKRAAMYVRLQDMLEETGAYVFLYHGVNAWVTRKNLAGSWTSDGRIAILKDIRSISPEGNV
ncbi:oligopeptide/dipeptide ABC transporter ATP-binding protein [Novosphingobium album (ex Liu et al. 2023)]|uniref:ABC transporter substrate-binding protein n=1 Tax=Novosphingobium album (ex Liu et al. 2023) TaxID=3031130 RepID=A0ABT5WXG0_9SPHN|nr:oligopeptide/dipeptide ABC transporter ATP-binding protein [Novosphingobium album (ex Liu et al. 2023)]MDE8654601.1 ABC transporter substrate-binding protein [Novosphingobium album (ex Liu et al. 2023)]